MAKKRTSRYKGQGKAARQRQQQRFWIGAGVLLALLVSGGAVFSLLSTVPEVSAERLEQEAHLGAEAPRVEVVKYGAYGCHACRAVHQSRIMERILENYGDQVRFTFRNVPIIHRNDPLAAEAAQCALDQGDGTFWAFHNGLYSISDSAYNDLRRGADYAALAAENGLDGAALEACLADNTHARTVDHWAEEGDRQRILGTPTFFVNGQRLNSAAQLESAVVAALNR
ncbi:MAG: thioredoxin domain-containing protein [Anaerolineae bacterium]|nr:thioredoxin domain-containing protein [Anaerolineae bacterium]